MPKENDLEGAQDQGGKHGGQAGMPRPQEAPTKEPDEVSARPRAGKKPANAPLRDPPDGPRSRGGHHGT